LPQQGTVAGGSATITTPNAATMFINQATDKAIINWNSFSIGTNELVKFMQPGAASVVLNRVTGVDPSSILGQLAANGRVFLVNPNGILFGSTAKIDVAGLVATTFNIKDSDFMSGKYVFEQDLTKAPSYVINQGEIKIADNGFAFLVAPAVANEGFIVAHLGKVVMGAGSDRLTIDMYGDGLVNFTIEGKVSQSVNRPDGTPFTSAVSNSGSITATGGQVFLTANASGSIFSSVINQSGIIEAKSLKSSEGKIVLQGGSEGLVSNTGTIDTMALEAGAGNGSAEISGADILVGGLGDGRIRTGSLLLDPLTVTILGGTGVDTANTLYENNIESYLNTTGSLTVSADALVSVALVGSADNKIDWNSANSLALELSGINANGVISFANNGYGIVNAGPGNITLDAHLATNGQLQNIGILTTTGGAINLLAGGNIELLNNVTTNGGILTISSALGSVTQTSGAITTGGTDLSITGVSLSQGSGASISTGAGTVTVDAGAVDIGGTITTLNKSVTFNGLSNGFSVTAPNGSISTGSGEVTINTASGKTIDLGFAGTSSFEISDASLGRIHTTGNVNIGSLLTGDITIGAINEPLSQLVITSGGSILVMEFSGPPSKAHR